MRNNVLICLLCFLPALSLSADSSELEDWENFDDLDSLFNVEEAVEEVEEPMADLGEDLERSGFTWGGRFDSEYTGLWSWTEEPLLNKWREADREAATPELSVDLYFDSRPDENFRVFGKLNLSYPEDTITIKELFADFDWEDKAYFRAGKQTVHWGVGYLYSPADVINLTAIDPLDFEAKREGPIAWKTQVPVDIHNAYLYVLYTGEDESGDFGDLALAPKVELVMGNNELGLGGYLQEGASPGMMATLTGPLRDFDYFGEAMLQYASREEELFFAGTAGFNYWKESKDLRLLGQYYYDGEKFSYLDTENKSGLHQGAAYLSWGSIGESDFDFTALWMGVFDEAAGMVRPEIIWKPLDMASLTTGVNWYYGDYLLHTTGLGLLPEGERGALNTRFEVFLTFKLGYGAF